MRIGRWLVYDGDCAFCSSSAEFLVRRVRPDVQIVPWQVADLTALGLTAEQCDDAVQWVSYDGSSRREESGPAAIAAVLRRGGPVWRGLGRGLGSRPGRVVAGPVYRFVARHRDRMPGGTPSCALPAAQRGGRPATTEPAVDLR